MNRKNENDNSNEKRHIPNENGDSSNNSEEEGNYEPNVSIIETENEGIEASDANKIRISVTTIKGRSNTPTHKLQALIDAVKLLNKR